MEMLVFMEGGKPENPEKNPRSKDENQQQTQPHMTPEPGIEPGPHWWEASALTTALLFVRLLVYDMYDLKKLKPLDPSKRVDCGAVRIHWSSPMSLRRTKKSYKLKACTSGQRNKKSL